MCAGRSPADCGACVRHGMCRWVHWEERAGMCAGRSPADFGACVRHGMYQWGHATYDMLAPNRNIPNDMLLSSTNVSMYQGLSPSMVECLSATMSQWFLKMARASAQG